MIRTEVKSSQVKSVGYDAEKQILEIEFLNRKEPDKPGSVYHYHDFSPAHWAGFRQQESIGLYLNRQIKPRFRCTKVEPDVQQEAAGEPKDEPSKPEAQNQE